MYRYFIGTVSHFGHLDRLFQFDSETRMDEDTVLYSFRAVLEKAGLKSMPYPEAGCFNRLGIESKMVYSFRGKELELPERLVEVDAALEQILPNEVLVIAYTFDHNTGSDYKHLLLVVPKGARLRHHGYMGNDRFTCDKDVNWWICFNDQMPRHHARLPKDTRRWNVKTKEWSSATELINGG